ncbi:PepSY-associated TM helix domain-containing protein [Parapedobacter koreensis]|uniref:Uncharacterized iron-regulated membrane protein n=1 Tax=Parapedobacter koreensis TaxID=332977 RepID=A0A1H7U9L1_9SPHI|nr:PepSY-associated TM helix domain-containing protein [Parapedobacter koreensis]SEL92967.1 Uncharacterized iron-regulated membrane protein [Parapedobacter koreensis]
MASANRSTWQKTRKLFNDIHLWLGLSSGLIIFVVCLSGTIYVFNTELTEWGTPHLYRVAPPVGAERKSPDAFLQHVEAHSGGAVSSVNVPSDPKRSYTYTVRTAGDNSRFGTAYLVNPYTGELLGSSTEKNAVKDFMSTMFSLHRWLLLDKIEQPLIEGLENRQLGSMISGWATIIFTLGCITGLVIWFPPKVKNWKQGLKIKMGRSWKRTNHDLHNSLAFYALALLLVMGITGPQWSFPWYRTGLQKTLGTYKPEAGPQGNTPGPQGNTPGPQPHGAMAHGHGAPDRALHAATADTAQQAPSLALSALIASADTHLPYPGDYAISLPASPGAPAQITKTKIGFFAPAAGDKVSLDTRTGALVSLDIFSQKPFNERIAGSIKALHVGNVYGTFSKILYFFACLIATTLPVTGTLIWINKMWKKQKRPRKAPIARQAVAQ